jgi:iron complex outermembrane recepter protein
VYSPINSGVFWDKQDLLLSNIEHIQVIRGPGATLWGANAVNGVINIITKSARETQGVLATAGIGTENQGLGGLRVGGPLGKSGYYRFSTKYLHGRDLFNTAGQHDIDTTVARVSGGSLTANWTRRQSGQSQTELRAYFTHRKEPRRSTK